MGLKFRLDVPEQAMEVTSVFFRAATPANEAPESMKMLHEQRSKNRKVIQEKMNLNDKEVKHFNPVDAFPSDIVIFGRVLNLLRGLSATMNARVDYIDIMRPFAESVLQCNLNRGPALNPRWIYDTPIHSDVEAKLRQLLVELGNAEKILGIQVCAYKDGEVIIDTAAGVLGKYDPRPVQPDSLFSVFSVTKGICAGLVHWLVDNGKLKLEDNVADIWPEFGSNGKDQIKVHHVLNHTSGLHNAMGGTNQEDPLLMTNWDECLKRIAASAPETAPAHEQLYHYLSFGWLCGGIIERASGRRFQELLEEAFVQPLKIDGELYVGIPPGMISRTICHSFWDPRQFIANLTTRDVLFSIGVESRLATLTVDMSDLTKLSNVGNRSDLPTTFQPQQIAKLATTLPATFNSLYARRAIIPAANGHCSARALARYYAALSEDGRVPPPHRSSMPTLGSHPHIPKFSSQQTVKKQKSQKRTCLGFGGPGRTQSSTSSIQNSSGHDGKGNVYIQIPSENSCSIGEWSSDNRNVKLFDNPRVHDAFMGVREYENLTFPNGMFGLGFKRSYSTNEELIGFGHSGLGGSTGFCNIKHKFAVAVTLNKLSFGTVTAKIIHLICSELNIPVPQEISKLVETGSASQLQISKPLIN
ncbi:putative basic leucine zipper 9-like [Capsicum annuum]|nr:putative basic leucine zipper 9-like [Capsicum annuum]